jgi:hypothetical protein
MATLGSGFISGITTTIFQPTDVVNKKYVDDYIGVIPQQTGNAGKFLTTIDGATSSWGYVSNYEEFTTTGEQTFTIPSYANLLYIEAVGAGGGGSVGQSNALAGVTWTLRTSGKASTFNALTFGNNTYIAAGTNSALITSTDAIIWTLRTSGIDGIINVLTFGNNIYVAGTSNGILGTSSDAIIWTLRTAGFINDVTGAINAIIFANNTYIAAGASSVLNTSTDTIHWTLRTSNLSNNIRSLAYGTTPTNNFVAAGDSGVISSTNAIIWILRTCSSGLFATYYANDTYVAGGDSGILRTSTDTIHWTSRTSGITSRITSFTFGENIYVFGGQFGIINTSTNAIIWTLRTSNTSNYIEALTFANNAYITAGHSSVLITSYSQASGQGGASGSYTSWYIPKNIISSNLTVNPGVGGVGATEEATLGSAGAGTTVSWTGPGGTYTLTASGGSGTSPGAAQLTSQSSSFYTTAGLSGAPQSPIGSGFTATVQTNQFQPTGGGSGAGSSLSFGGGSEINVYGISTSASGGTTFSVNGSAGIAYTGLPYGSGGGGGGTGETTVGNGGNGVRGGGGGGGASIGSTFGNGGNGGNGYVKITWW